MNGIIRRTPLDPGNAILRGMQIKDQRSMNQSRNRLLDQQFSMNQKQLEQQDAESAQLEKARNTIMLATFNKLINQAPEDQREATYQRGIQFLQEKGIDPTGLGDTYADAKQRLDFESRFAQDSGLVDSGGDFGRLVAGQDAQGNPVFLQTDKSGKVRVADGVRPPETAAEARKRERQDEQAKDKSSSTITLTASANAFSDTLSHPEISSATGLRGAIEGGVGKLTGSQAGVLKARLERRGTAMVLQAAESLSGAMSDGDIALLKSTMPDGLDDAAIWRDWYSNDFVPMVRAKAAEQGIDFSSLGIPEEIPGGDTQEPQQPQQQTKAIKFLGFE